jgi:thymidine kinase
MEVNFRCVLPTAINRFVNFELGQAIEEGKKPKHISNIFGVDVNDIETDVFIISNAQNIKNLRNFILKCEKFNKSVVVIFDDSNINDYEENVLPAIPLCDSVNKENSKKNLPKIVLCTGPMRGGKSQEVIRLIDHCKVLDMIILCIHPLKDTRSGDYIGSRNGKKIPSNQVEALMNINKNKYDECDVIVIDEAQFFPDLYEFVKRCKADGKSVFISGLDGDFNRNPFGEVLRCIPLCDKVSKFNALCMVKNKAGEKNAGEPAIFSMLDPIKKEQLAKQVDGNVLIGDADFLSVSREAYLQFNSEI